MRIRLVAAALYFLCELPVVGAQSPAAHIIGQIDGAADDIKAELVGARTPLLTDDGRFVVANQDPLEVRVYSLRGRLQHVIGREGEGPGEYRSAVSLVAWPGDSVLVYSSGTRRMSLFSLDGTLVREWRATATEIPFERIAVTGNVVLKTGGINGAAGCARALIPVVVPASAPLTVAITDPFGRLWVRQTGGAEWQVHGAGGRRVATVRLPDGLVIRQFRGDTVVGTTVDEDGFTNVTAIATGAGSSGRADGRPCDNPLMPVTQLRSAMMRTALRNAFTFGEAYHGREGDYPARPAQLPDGVHIEGASYRIPVADANSWVVILRDDATGYHCLMSVGPGGIPGITGNAMRCASRIS